MTRLILRDEVVSLRIKVIELESRLNDPVSIPEDKEAKNDK